MHYLLSFEFFREQRPFVTIAPVGLYEVGLLLPGPNLAFETFGVDLSCGTSSFLILDDLEKFLLVLLITAARTLAR